MSLRHTAATLMLQENVHPKVVQERLGHSDISLTLNTYSHVLPGMQDEAAEKIDEAADHDPAAPGFGSQIGCQRRKQEVNGEGGGPR